LRLNDARTAVAWLTRAASAAPNDVKLLTALAAAQVRAGNGDDAQATIARGLEEAPNDPTLMALRRRAQPPADLKVRAADAGGP
jgi:Flp pilus assembly protein TadD